MRSTPSHSSIYFLIAALSIAGCSTPGENSDGGDAGAAANDLFSTVPDLAVRVPDLAGTCLPACFGGLPICANGRCVACLTDAHCPIGMMCKLGSPNTCVPGCSDDKGCKGLAPDGGASPRCCSGACTDTGSDNDNCGACGSACSLANAAATCTGGKCLLGACNAGWADCNKDPKDGCELNLRVDVANCGGCGTVCTLPNAIAGCASGCFVSACVYGFDDCNHVVADGCETPLLADSHNCGACGTTCQSTAHAKGTCTAGACGLVCDNNFGNCDGDLKNGCESPLQTDAKNCSKCGMACAQGLICSNGACTCPQCNFANAKSACVMNVCTLVSCLAGFADCNMKAQDGCEANLSFDSSNCGKCGTVCPMNLPACTSGVCGMVMGPAPIPDQGWTHDVVLNNGLGALDGSQDAMDGSNNCLMTQSAATQIGGTAGLPDTGFFPKNADHPDVQLQYNNNDDGPNARLVRVGGGFHLDVPHRTYKGLQMFATSTEGASTIVVTLNYADATTDSHTFVVTDWFNAVGANQFVLIKGLQRYSIGTMKADAQKIPDIVGFDLSPDPAKPLHSVDLSETAGPGWFIYFGAVGW